MPREEDMEVRIVEEELDLFPAGDRGANSSHPSAIREQPEVPEAQMRSRKKPVKIIGLDDYQELRNSDLAQWNAGYPHNMAAAAKLKQNNKLLTQAKRNASFWVLGCGIGSVGIGLGISRVPHPLGSFSGEGLLGALTGTHAHASSRKRSHSTVDSSGSGSQERHVRMREDDNNHLGREEDIALEGPGIVYDVRGLLPQVGVSKPKYINISNTAGHRNWSSRAPFSLRRRLFPDALERHDLDPGISPGFLC